MSATGMVVAMVTPGGHRRIPIDAVLELLRGMGMSEQTATAALVRATSSDSAARWPLEVENLPDTTETNERCLCRSGTVSRVSVLVVVVSRPVRRVLSGRSRVRGGHPSRPAVTRRF